MTVHCGTCENDLPASEFDLRSSTENREEGSRHEMPYCRSCYTLIKRESAHQLKDVRVVFDLTADEWRDLANGQTRDLIQKWRGDTDTPGPTDAIRIVLGVMQKEAEAEVEAEVNPQAEKYKGYTWDLKIDEAVASMKPKIVLPKRGKKQSTGRIADFGTTKLNAPTFLARDLQPGILYGIYPWPGIDWWMKIGIIQAEPRALDGRLRRDYEKNVPPHLRHLIDYEVLFYMERRIASAERHLIHVLERYGVQDRREYFVFAEEQAPHMVDIITRTILAIDGAELYHHEKDI